MHSKSVHDTQNGVHDTENGVRDIGTKNRLKPIVLLLYQPQAREAALRNRREAPSGSTPGRWLIRSS
jgi:hypothetical protein